MNALAEGQVATNTSAISALTGRVDNLEGVTIAAIDQTDIEALFA